MQRKTLFSIIVPVYNVEPYIERCINSVIQQQYDEWELLLIDDGSSDNSALICDKYAADDKRIKVIHKDNNGVSSARNVGLRSVNGDYITFIDADDYWETSNVLSHLAAQPESDVYYMLNAILRYPSGDSKILSRESLFHDDYIRTHVASDFAKSLDNGGWACYYGFYSRRVIHNIFFDQSIKIGEDFDWFFRVLDNADSACFIKLPYYNYCINRVGSAMFTKKADALITLFKLVAKWERLANMKPDPYSQIHIILCNTAVNYLRVIGTYNNEEKILVQSQFVSSNALQYATSTKAKHIRRWIKIIGIDSYVFLSNKIYKLRLLGRDLKQLLMKAFHKAGG